MRKLTLEFVKSEFEKRGYNLLENEYVTSDTKMRFECSKHRGLHNSVRYHCLKRGVGCTYCGAEASVKNRRASLEEIEQEFSKRGYKLLESSYKNNRTPLRFICPNHQDKETKITYHSLKRGAGCRYCAGTGKPTVDEVRREFSKRGYNLLSDVYVNGRTKLEYECPRHPEYPLKITYENFNNLNQGCPHCAGVKNYSIEEVKQIFKEAGYSLLETEYINNRAPMRFICPKHPKEETKTTLRNLQKGTRCRFCYLENNKGESHPNYNPYMDERERKSKRLYLEYYDWRRAVFVRDNYSCTVCGDSKGGNLVAHHKDGYGYFKERRTDVTNGVTLCGICHKEFHSIYGYRNNTEDQYLHWIKTREASE